MMQDKRKENRQILTEILTHINHDTFLALNYLYKNSQKHIGDFSTIHNKNMATTEVKNKLYTTYGSVKFKFIVDGAITAVNMEERKLFSDDITHTYLIFNTQDYLKLLSVL